MGEKTIQWNLGFPPDEVIAGLEKLLAGAAVVYTREERGTEVCVRVSLASGSLTLTVRPLLAPFRPFNFQGGIRRTLLLMTFSEVNAQEEEAFLRRLTLAFLRVGG